MDNVTLSLLYNGGETAMQCKRSEYLKDIIAKYFNKIGENLKNYLLLYNGDYLNKELKIKDFNESDNKIPIVITNYNTIIINNDQNIMRDSRDVICPECGENCIINIDNYKINLNNCSNGHNYPNLDFNDFLNSQKIDESKIYCDKCKKNKMKIYNNELYKCCNCKINLCPLCKSCHDKNHSTINYDLKNYMCNNHNERHYITYCRDCNKNLCDLCEVEHNKEHSFINYKDIIINENTTKINHYNLKVKIDNLKNEINKIINKLKEFLDKLELYYNISNKIINNYDIKKKNYQI